MSTQQDHNDPTKDHSAGSDLSRSDASHAPTEQHIADKPVAEDSAGAPAAEPTSPQAPQVDLPAKPIAGTPPVSPTSDGDDDDDDDDFAPRGKVTQTYVGGGQKGTGRPR
ncbi:hypothetical protein K466DRAFT_585792 [Polyporus arcularius HHB13444]|uniref:Uncharacterized protein n=1 Tax=Polyporus arcularius HHB13444 TaxID=1314778 RepID=A0A5C3PGK1_9APHY|nr:hypothetical protein K466DRAFT_585792 [Polyporus arcularius HHB13444]